MDIEEDDDLFKQQDDLEKQVFDCSVAIKKLLSSITCPPEETLDGKNLKLPKLDVPKFDGNIWEQFAVTIHDCAHLSDLEKLVYLQQSLGSAKTTIQGLSRSGNYYAEAVACLRECYDKLRFIRLTYE